MARVLLLGARGMLGSAVHRALSVDHLVTAPDRAEFDILAGRWRSLLLDDTDWVVNAAGLIPRRAAMCDVGGVDASWIVNAVFPQALAAACMQNRVRLLHVSTDCVFAGIAGPHDEDYPPDARDVYGRSKAIGEPASAMVLRTSIVGCERPYGDNLLGWTLRQDRIDGYTNHLWNGLTTLAFARVVAALIARDCFAPGIHHVHGETVTKCTLIRMICDAWNHDATVRPAAAPASRDQRLSTRRSVVSGVITLPALHDQLTEMAALSTKQGQWRAAPTVAEFAHG